MAMTNEDIVRLTDQLETQELESPGGIATPQTYGQLLAVYLLQNDLPNAKFLWKRIPVTIKSTDAELTQIWAVGQKMWHRDFPGIYQCLNKEWSENMKNLMTALTEATKIRAFNLVSQAYSSISIDDFAAFVGVSTDNAINVAVEHGWAADDQNKVIIPKKPENTQCAVIPSEQHLSRLTDFVSFLEN
ncbi:COP9 signalosome complex subunit 8-like [Tubulanus polymorphus]|uniref:COP9 signalosome complex subunit 8-like n=1 Tax=Tubulanus polymorphus TaxID=672921 RepID=UPI003DA28CC6